MRRDNRRSRRSGIRHGRPGDQMGQWRLTGIGTAIMRKRILFICGSMNQTTQMHQIALHLSDYEQAFSPYYCHGIDEVYRRLGLMEFTIIGHKLASRCRRYLEDHDLAVDYQGRNKPYDLVLTCSDVYI